MVGKFARTALVSLALAFGGVSASPSCDYKIVESSIVENGTIVQLSLANMTNSAWTIGKQFQLDLGSPNLLDIGFHPENSVDIIDSSENIYTFEVLETPNDSVLQMMAERECSESCSTSISVMCRDGSRDSTTPAAKVLSLQHDSEFGPLGLWHSRWRRKRHRHWAHKHRRFQVPRRCRQPPSTAPNGGNALICPANVQHTLVKAVPCNGLYPYAASVPAHQLSGFPTGVFDWKWGRFIERANGKAEVTGVLFNAQVRFKVYILLSGRQFDESGLNPLKKDYGHCASFDTSSWYFYRNVRGWMLNKKTWEKFSLSNEGTRPAQLGTSANVKNSHRGLAFWLQASNGSGQKAGIDFNNDVVCKS